MQTPSNCSVGAPMLFRRKVKPSDLNFPKQSTSEALARVSRSVASASIKRWRLLRQTMVQVLACLSVETFAKGFEHQVGNFDMSVSKEAKFGTRCMQKKTSIGENWANCTTLVMPCLHYPAFLGTWMLIVPQTSTYVPYNQPCRLHHLNV